MRMLGLLRPHIPLVHYRSAPDRIPADERFNDEDDGYIERPHIPLVHYRSASDRILADKRFDNEDDGFIETSHTACSLQVCS